MGETKETMEIRQVHDNNKYIITRNIIDTVNGEELLKIYKQVKEAYDQAKLQTDDMPKQYKAREEFLNKELKTIGERMDILLPFAKKLEDLSEDKPKPEIPAKAA